MIDQQKYPRTAKFLKAHPNMSENDVHKWVEEQYKKLKI